MICRTTGTALLQKMLRTEREANMSSALLRISFVSSNSAWLSECWRPTERTIAAWKALKLPSPLVYHLYGVNWGDSRRVWKTERAALADAMHFARDSHVSGVTSPWIRRQRLGRRRRRVSWWIWL